MTALEYLVEELQKRSTDLTMWHNDILVKAEMMERNKIIRAVNYSIMNLDKLREQAIKEKITIGELYVKMNKDENNNKENNSRT